MTRRLERRIGEIAPVREEDVDALRLASEAELLRQIVAQPRDGEGAGEATAGGFAPRAAGQPRRRRPRRQVGLTLAASAVVGALALAGVSLTSGGDLRAGPEHAWADEALRVARAVPRLLIAADGWRVVRADEFAADEGEVTFANGDREVRLLWRAREGHASAVDGWVRIASRGPDADVAGARAAMFHSDLPINRPGTCFVPAGERECLRTAPGVPYRLHVAVWRSGAHSMELRMEGERLGRERFAAVLRAVRPVGVDAWLSAMPPSVVKPADRVETVRDMLAGVPLPPGFDAAGLEGGEALRDRYQLGADVTSTVVCAWIDRWDAARRRGDATAAREAAAALATARRWPILRELEPMGGLSAVVWDHADAVNGANGGRVLGGKGMPAAESAVEALNCAVR